MHFIKLSIFFIFIIQSGFLIKNVNYCETKLNLTEEKKKLLLNRTEKKSNKLDIFNFIAKKERIMKEQNKMKEMNEMIIVLFKGNKIASRHQQPKQIVLSMNQIIITIPKKCFGFKNRNKENKIHFNMIHAVRYTYILVKFSIMFNL